MKRTDLHELGYIVPIESVKSILERGILSHERAERIAHRMIAMHEIQDLRANVVVPGGLRLHQYANLYICPRNPMLLKKRNIHEQICVLQVRPAVLDFPGAVITTGNAASKYTRFLASPEGLEAVNQERTFAEWWTHDDQIEKWRHSSEKCAEVLIPNVVQPRFIFGAYISCTQSREIFQQAGIGLPVTVNPGMFFQ
jgi:hypothetical protein